MQLFFHLRVSTQCKENLPCDSRACNTSTTLSLTHCFSNVSLSEKDKERNELASSNECYLPRGFNCSSDKTVQYLCWVLTPAPHFATLTCCWKCVMQPNKIIPWHSWTWFFWITWRSLRDFYWSAMHQHMCRGSFRSCGLHTGVCTNHDSLTCWWICLLFGVGGH